VKVAAIQHDICWEDPLSTLRRLAPLVERAVEAGARLVVLTEMFSTGFSMAAERIAEPVDGPSSSWLVDQAARACAWFGASVPTLLDGFARPVNAFILASPDGQVVRYAKRHPFTHAGEHTHYDAGRETVTVDIDGVRVTPTVCYDLRFADLYWTAAPVTDLYLVVASWPAARRLHWRSLLVARAIENQAYVVGVNRVGAGDGLVYVGDSVIIDPMGDTVATAADDETVLTGEVDPSVVNEVRRRFPFLNDR
jgi:predicted amidohydrolase